MALYYRRRDDEEGGEGFHSVPPSPVPASPADDFDDFDEPADAPQAAGTAGAGSASYREQQMLADVEQTPVFYDAEDQCFDEEFQKQLSLPGLDTPKHSEAGDAASDLLPPESEEKPWDVSHGPMKTGQGIERMTMVLPAVTRAMMNVVGGSMAASGYAVGKVGEIAGRGKAVDSTVFRAGFTSWMWSNGIFPNVEWEPIDGCAAQLEELHGVESPQAADASLTPILVSNHTCYLDGPILAGVFGTPKIVAMAGSRKAPIFGKLLEEMEAVFVDRSSGDSRQQTMDAINQHCTGWRSGSRPLLIFPEGTTTNGEVLAPFKRGAFNSGSPVRPIIMVYTGQWDPASTTYRKTETGELLEVSSDEWGKQFIGHFVHSLHVRVLAPYFPSEDERADPDVYALHVQAHMQQAIGRIRAEITEKSWKEAAGRSNGGLGYKFGDLTRMSVRRVQGGYMSAREVLAGIPQEERGKQKPRPAPAGAWPLP